MSQNEEGVSHSASRDMALYLQATFYERQQRPDGHVYCAYCWKRLRFPKGSGKQRDKGPNKGSQCLDHINNDPRNLDEDNVVAACRACNTAVGIHDERGQQLLLERLEQEGVDPGKSAAQLQRILSEPLRAHAGPLAKKDPRVVAMASKLFGDRIQFERDGASIRRARRKSSGPKSPRRSRATRQESIPF